MRSLSQGTSHNTESKLSPTTHHTEAILRVPVMIPRRAFSCDPSNIVYVVRCISYNILYIGETLRTLEEKVREHIRNIQGQELKYPVARHFCQAGDSLIL